ncbi:MAG: spermidine synthase [Verrucomicrobiales bacterium]|nr:methyltransferase domain-containing protein [Verrucomicrobiota bacterium JB025]
MRLHEIVRTRYQTLEVWKSDDEVEFRVAGAVHAWFHRERYLTGLAWDMIAASALLGEKERPDSVLMLGLAGGTSFRTLRHLLPDCRLTAVDIDEEIVEVSRQHMGLDELGVEVEICDGYGWLEENRRKFDVVIDDIYLAGDLDVYRPKVPDEAVLGLYRKALEPGGVLAVNLVLGPGHRTTQSRVRREMGRGFAELRSVRSPKAMNEVLVAGDKVATRRRLAGYTDRFSRYSDRECWEHLALRRIS